MGELVERVAGVATADFRRRGRRSWTPDEKLAIVKEAESGLDPVAVVARRHGMNANHLHLWVSRARQGTLYRRRGRRRLEGPAPMAFIDLGVTGAAVIADPKGDGGIIEIELPGGARVRVVAGVDGEALRRVLLAVKAAL